MTWLKPLVGQVVFRIDPSVGYARTHTRRLDRDQANILTGNQTIDLGQPGTKVMSRPDGRTNYGRRGLINHYFRGRPTVQGCETDSTTPVWCVETDFRSYWDDAVRVNGRMAEVVVVLDVVEIDSSGNPGPLVDLTGVGPQVGIVDQPSQVALEVGHIDRVETHQRGEQAPVGLGDLVAG